MRCFILSSTGFFIAVLFLATLGAGLCPGSAQAQEIEFDRPVFYNDFGAPGLFHTPSARMPGEGTLRIGYSDQVLYRHISLNAQVASWLNLNLRQSTDILNESLRKGQNFPGIDLRVRLMEEGEYRPALAVGIRSAIGARRLQAEYLVAAKRWYNWDAHIGIGWGRLAGENTIRNPLSLISGHFDNGRDFNNRDREHSKIEDFLTGNRAGLFGGVTYQTPVKGVALHAEWSALNFDPESNEASDPVDSGLPLSLGVTARPHNNISLGMGWENLERIMLRAAFSFQADRLPLPNNMAESSLPPLRYSEIKGGDHRLVIRPDIERESVPAMIARLADKVVDPAPSDAALQEAPTPDDLTIITQKDGLKGYEITLVGHDLKARQRYLTTPPEIWHNSRIVPYEGKRSEDYTTDQTVAPSDRISGWEKFKRHLRKSVTLGLSHNSSLQEPGETALHRTRAYLRQDWEGENGFIGGYQIGLNLFDNFDDETRGLLPALFPIRSDIQDFHDNRFWLDRLWLGRNHTLGSGLYFNTIAGHLEEVFSGGGMQMLYRPLGKRYAAQISLWGVAKRDPDQWQDPLTVMQEADFQTLTGHLDLFYEAAGRDTTYRVSAGRFLGEDWGVGAGILHRFANGVQLDMNARITFPSEVTVINNTFRTLNLTVDDNPILVGVNLRIPLHQPLGLPVKFHGDLYSRPLARDTGQRLQVPYDLYKETEDISVRHLTRNWNDIRAQ